MLTGFLCLPFWLAAQTQQNQIQSQLIDPVRNLDSVVVSAVSAESKSPIAHTQLHLEDLKKSPPTMLLPFSINLTPGVVGISENGTGVGNSYLRIRGSDASRIGVTLNGIALNDAESQEVFWVNLPALTSFLDRVQVQRGIGSSVSGPGAFGGGVHLQTMSTSPDSYGEVNFSAGSYQTYMTMIGAGSGVQKGFSFDLRYAQNQTKGYIRNGKANMHSGFARASYAAGKHVIRLNWIGGTHVTGITWEGVSPEMMALDRRSNPAGAYSDAAGNIHYYDNETDNYSQNHLQCTWLYAPMAGVHWSTTLNYTRGDGYYENYKQNRRYSDYGLPDQEVAGAMMKRSDMIQQAKMGNSHYVLSSIFDYRKAHWHLLGGITGSLYSGAHWGNLVWVMYHKNIPSNYQWYKNHSIKYDVSLFVRSEYTFELKELTLYADLQYRTIDYSLSGPDKDFVPIDHHSQFHFINPKIGLVKRFPKNHQLSLGCSVGHKEPTRSDNIEVIKAGRPNDLKPESMLDWEFGYRHTRHNAQYNLTLYYMEYKDQLVPTGKLSETGYVVKENVASSYRAGSEFALGWQPIQFLKVEGNLCLSINRIKEYTAWVDLYDNPNNWMPLPQRQEHYKNVSLAYSPQCTAAMHIETKPWKRTTASFRGKYVGKQYYDNTGNASRSLPSYGTGGVWCSHLLMNKNGKQTTLSLFIDNLFNQKYIDNAWVYRAAFADGSAQYLETGIFPQAEINFTLSLSCRF